MGNRYPKFRGLLYMYQFCNNFSMIDHRQFSYLIFGRMILIFHIDNIFERLKLFHLQIQMKINVNYMCSSLSPIVIEVRYLLIILLSHKA